MIADYERLGVAAQTATTTVWKGFDQGLKRSVALKQLTGPDAAAAARREATVLAQLHHPNIVSVHDVFDDDAGVWLVEEWVTGAPLSAVLTKLGRLRAIEGLALIYGALQGLSYAHDQNIVHGDIAPTNILINQTGTPMLVDFGLALTPGETSVGGTPGYMAPEAAAAQPVDKRSDVYRGCVVLAELLKGARLFPHHTALAATQHQSTDAPALAGIERPVAEVLHHGLDPMPEARPADAKTLLSQLDNAAEETHGRGWLALAGLGALGSTAATISAGVTLTSATGTASATAAPAAAATKSTGLLSRGRLLAAGGASAAIIVALVAFFLMRPERPTPTASSQPSSPPAASIPTSGAAPAAASAGPLFSGTYKQSNGPWTGRVISDCPGCDATLIVPAGSGVLSWNGVRWEGPVAIQCGSMTVTATPSIVANGIAQELAEHVPVIAPLCVLNSPPSRLRPKSANTTRSSHPSRTLVGLMSQCTTPAACAA
jgi:serine/threonine-protein kinase